MYSLEFLAAALTGLGTELALIVAIGAQGAFVLRQGLSGQHVGLVVSVCLASDVVLITAGIAGIGQVLAAVPVAVAAARFGGAAYLFVYAALAARRCLRAGDGLHGGAGGTTTAKAALAAVLAVTWLNPHVYLDTLLLLGSLANTHGQLRWGFGLGALAASVVWFTGLGYGAAVLRPIFANPKSWQLLDAATALVMVALGAAMLAGD